jgi:putative FmdB family regulatory protein
MPLYDFQCSKGHKFERFVKLADFDTLQTCACGESASRLISAPMFVATGINYSYDCPITGTHITSKSAHEENLKRHGCRVLETNEKDFNARQRATEEAAFERNIEASVERAIETMPGEKREQLGKELSRNDVAIERGTVQ